MIKTNSSLTTFNLFLYAFFCLIIGLFTVKAYFSLPIFWIAAYLIISFFLIRPILRNDIMGFVLILFFLSHFSYLENQGGLWNILAFTTYSILIFRKNKNRFFKTDQTTFSLLLILLLLNIIGWIFISNASLILRIQGFVMLCSYMLTFVLISNIKLTPFQIKRFFNLLFIISIYIFFVAINQRFGFIDSQIPLLPPKTISDGKIALSTNANSTFGNSELYGEYCVLIFLLTLSVSKSKALKRLFFSKNYFPNIIIILSVIGTFLSGSRSSIVLIIVTVFIFFISIINNLSNTTRFLRKIIYVALILGLFYFFDFDFGFNSSNQDFKKLNQTSITLQTVISGESINRFELFQHALTRLNSQSWFFGAGLGPLESNKLAWWGFTENTPYIDFHNLYFTLPMLYGYTGAFIFLFFMVRIAVLSFMAYKKNKAYIHLNTILLVMPYFWLIFFIDEWKISMIRNSNYHMLIWMFLGLNMAMLRTLKHKN